MGSTLPDIGLNLKLYASKTINGFLNETMEAGERGGKATKLEGFIRDLEVERRKIEVFKRELPLSMHLLGDSNSHFSDAI
jgi:hypothetical protein